MRHGAVPRLASFALAFAVIPALGCASTTSSDDVSGELVYAEPFEDGNSFACATCHALEEPADDGIRRVGHPIGDASRRPSWKNGRYTELRDAVNTCVTHWMNAEPLAEDDPRWQALFAFLDAAAPSETAPAIAFDVVAPAAELDGGDAETGHALFDRTCATCHGAGAMGTGRAPPLAGGDYEAAYVAERVRRSGSPTNPAYDGLTGGIMPFWSAQRLSDPELRDLIAYVQSLADVPIPSADGGVTGGGDGGVTGGGCDATHARVGQTATLSTRFHGVRGTARIADDCTIVVEGFSFDGRGIDVRVYGGLGGDYDAGFAISGDLVRSTPYAAETLTLTLPPGRTLDELDGISVWCVDVGVSFGEGAFTP